MLSIDNLPGPSCPSEASALVKSDERTSDQLAFQEADPVGLAEIQTSNFSIRDYVFTSRSKDIVTCWPFSRKFLRVCLKHGIKDVLPPFEQTDLVRSQLCKKEIALEQLVASPEAEQITTQVDLLQTGDVNPFHKEVDSVKCDSALPSDELNCSDQARYTFTAKGKPTVDQVENDELNVCENEIHSTVTSNDQTEKILSDSRELPSTVQISRSVSEPSSELEVSEAPRLPEKLAISQGQVEKKCRLIVKLSAVSEANQEEDILSNSSTVSDVMASKVCPVCKIFSSTSNTTLNAHMDQCLSVESNAKRDVSSIPKLQVKPRKKRLMVDIYATAPHCTLEDLDRRNGTNWVSEMSLLSTNYASQVEPTNEANMEVKKLKLSPGDIRDNGNEGAVYVDSNGIKLRILSKSNDAASLVSRKDISLGKHAKNMKASKSFMNKKKCFGFKHPKYMKMKSQSKNSSLCKLSEDQIQIAPEGDYIVDSHQEKDEPETQRVKLNACDQVKGSGFAMLRQWVCSKRSDLPKKINRKDICRSSEIPVITTRNPLAESDQAATVDPPVVESDVLEFSRSPEDLNSSPKTKRMAILCSPTQTMDSGKKKSPKLPIFSSRWTSEGSSSANGLLLRLSRSTRKVVSSPRSRRDENHKDTTVRPHSCQPALKAKKSSTLKKNILSGRSSFSLKAKKGDGRGKHMVLNISCKSRSLLLAGKGVLPGAKERLHGSTEDIGLKDTRSNKTKGIHRSNILDNAVRSSMEEILDQSSPCNSKIQESDQEVEGMHVEPMVCADAGMGSAMDRAVHDTNNAETVIPGKLKPTSNAELNTRSSVEEYKQPVFERETQIEHVTPRLLDEQAMQNVGVTCNQIITQIIPMADEVEFRGKESSMVQCTDSDADTVCIQESNACLTSHGDVDCEIPQESSSVTSAGAISSQDHKAIDRETSCSPVSTASTSSFLSPKDSEVEPSHRATAILNNPCSSLSNNLGLPSMASIGGTEETVIEMRNWGAMAAPSPNELQQFMNSQPCCCSRRDSVSKDPLLSRPSIITAMPIRPSISTFCRSSTSSRTDMVAVPSLELPAGSAFTKASSDSAMKVSNFIDFSSPSPSPRTQTLLRLMGKNLMVNREQSVQLPAPSDNSGNGRCFSPLGFVSTSSISNQESSLYHHYDQLPDRTEVLGYLPSLSNYQMPDVHPDLMVKADQWIHVKKSSKKLNHLSAFNTEGAVASHEQGRSPTSSQSPYMMREVIVIDDSPEHEAESRASLVNPSTSMAPSFPASNFVLQRSFSCFPPQSQLLAREALSCPELSFSVSCPRTNANPIIGGSTSQGSTPILQRPFLFSAPSTGHLAPPLYYSQRLR